MSPRAIGRWGVALVLSFATTVGADAQRITEICPDQENSAPVWVKVWAPTTLVMINPGFEATVPNLVLDHPGICAGGPVELTLGLGFCVPKRRASLAFTAEFIPLEFNELESAVISLRSIEDGRFEEIESRLFDSSGLSRVKTAQVEPGLYRDPDSGLVEAILTLRIPDCDGLDGGNGVSVRGVSMPPPGGGT